MAVASLDRCMTELADEHERHRMIVGSLQGCTQLLLTDELRSQLNGAIAEHRAYMVQVEGARTVLGELKGLAIPELNDELSAQLHGQLEGVMAGLKPVTGRLEPAKPVTSPSEEPHLPVSEPTTEGTPGPGQPSEPTRDGPRGRRP